MNEFELIKTFFDWADSPEQNIVKSIGDDCSIVQVPAGFELVQSIDTQVADVHFPTTAPAHLIAQRALRCALSDLAAMGAQPLAFHLAISLPKEFPNCTFNQWLESFSQGLKACADEFKIPLIGGDTTSAPLPIVTIQVQGLVPIGKGLTRSGANVGDDIWISGPIGESSAALSSVLKNPILDSGLAAAYYYPQPQIQFGQKLISLASSALDISDGLIQDASHIAKASNTTLSIASQYLEHSSVMSAGVTLEHMLYGGDDYQLLFTAPPAAVQSILDISQQIEHAAAHKIGSVMARANHTVLLDGKPAKDKAGYQHF